MLLAYFFSTHQIIVLLLITLIPPTFLSSQANEIVTSETTDITNTNDQRQSEPPDKIGEPPEDDISHLFVRESEVLLAPREVQIIFGVSYSSEEDYSNLRKARDRTFSFPLVVSIGITNDLESYISIPFVYTESEYTSFGEGEKNENSGLGDISLGFSHRLLPETLEYPSITVSFKVQVPTDDNNDTDTSESPATSSGYWGVSSSISFTRSIDPAIMFFSFGLNYQFEDEKYGLDLRPGNTYFYSFGTGLSINSAISLSGRVSGSYSEELEVNGQKRVGSNNEPVSLVLTSIYRINKKLSLETFVDFGLNEDANSTSFGFNYIYNL
ncbi:MAG: transporter [Candidatus Thiodiazotropha sp.]